MSRTHRTCTWSHGQMLMKDALNFDSNCPLAGAGRKGRRCHLASATSRFPSAHYETSKSSYLCSDSNAASTCVSCMFQRSCSIRCSAILLLPTICSKPQPLESGWLFNLQASAWSSAGVFRYAGQFQESLWGARPVGVVRCPRAPMAKTSMFDEGGGDRERRASQCHFLGVA